MATKKPQPEAAPKSAHEGALYVPAKDPEAAKAAGIRSPRHPSTACALINRADHSVHVQYGSETLMLSPRQGAKHPCIVDDESLLQKPLPKGVTKIPVPKHLKSN